LLKVLWFHLPQSWLALDLINNFCSSSIENLCISTRAGNQVLCNPDLQGHFMGMLAQLQVHKLTLHLFSTEDLELFLQNLDFSQSRELNMERLGEIQCDTDASKVTLPN